MIIDSHVHLFSASVIAGVSARTDLVNELHLETSKAASRTKVHALVKEGAAAGLDACLLLPVAGRDRVSEVNQTFHEIAGAWDMLLTAGTLHPASPRNHEELARLSDRGVRAIKFCSFSQGFEPEAGETFALFDMIQEHNTGKECGFFVVIDTFYKAQAHFGSPPGTITTPARLGRLVHAYPEIDFVASHMGGLTAPFSEILEHLTPRENLYLETSNAAHTLREEEFIHLLKVHGASRVLFGTDWPWFGPADEMKRIGRLLDLAGYSCEEKAAVFGGNMARLIYRDR
jgi:predicted TIM-barrel fold metal-dependent hydrolase